MPEDFLSENTPQTGKRTREYYRRIGSTGGKVIKDRYGSAYFSTIGKKGGASTKALYGRAHYQQMGRRGGGARSRTDEKRVVEVL